MPAEISVKALVALDPFFGGISIRDGTGGWMEEGKAYLTCPYLPVVANWPFLHWSGYSGGSLTISDTRSTTTSTAAAAAAAAAPPTI